MMCHSPVVDDETGIDCTDRPELESLLPENPSIVLTAGVSAPEDVAVVEAEITDHPEFDSLFRHTKVEHRFDMGEWTCDYLDDYAQGFPEYDANRIQHLNAFSAETKFKGKHFRCESTNGIIPLADMIVMRQKVAEWVWHCLLTGFPGINVDDEARTVLCKATPPSPPR